MINMERGGGLKVGEDLEVRNENLSAHIRVGDIIVSHSGAIREIESIKFDPDTGEKIFTSLRVDSNGEVRPNRITADMVDKNSGSAVAEIIAVEEAEELNNTYQQQKLDLLVPGDLVVSESRTKRTVLAIEQDKEDSTGVAIRFIRVKRGSEQKEEVLGKSKLLDSIKAGGLKYILNGDELEETEDKIDERWQECRRNGHAIDEWAERWMIENQIFDRNRLRFIVDSHQKADDQVAG